MSKISRLKIEQIAQAMVNDLFECRIRLANEEMNLKSKSYV